MASCPPAYAPLHLWLLFVGLLAFGLFVAGRAGLLATILETDVTHISTLIGVLLVLGSAHCGLRIAIVSTELERLAQIIGAVRAAPGLATREIDAALARHAGLASAYLDGVRRRALAGAAVRGEAPGAGELTAIFSEQARRQHAAGWFLAGALVKLGLLGTVIGFVLMLRSVGAVESFDVGDVQRIMQLMSQGMGVALYTTLVGLLSSMALGFQYLCADQAANRLVAVAGEFAQRELLDLPEG